MSALGSVGSTPNLFAHLRSLSVDESGETAPPESQPLRAAGMAARIDQALAAAGVGEETAASLKADLTYAFEEHLASGKEPPDREAMKTTIAAVFSKYGLDADEILGPPSHRGSHGAGGSEGCGTRQADPDEARQENHQTLLELLDQMSQQGASSEDLSQLLIDAINGIDQTA